MSGLVLIQSFGTLTEAPSVLGDAMTRAGIGLRGLTACAKAEGMLWVSQLSKSSARKGSLCCGLGRNKQNRIGLEGLTFGSHDGEGRTVAAVEEAA